MNTNLKGKPKARLTMKIVRNGKEYELPLSWKIRNFWKKTKEAFLRALGFNVGYANVLTQVGEEQYVDWLQKTTNYIGWGTGAGTHDKTSTTLFTESAETRVAASESQPVADKLRYEGTLTAAAAKTITNAGVLTASTAGTLIVASDFTGVALGTGEGIKFQWDVEIT